MSRLSVMAAAALVAGAVVSANAAIVDVGDTFPGTAGNGWTGGWTNDGIGRGWGEATSFGTATGTPIMAGDSANYISAWETSVSGGGWTPTWAKFSRGFTSSGDVDLAKPYTISFDLRTTVGAGPNAYFTLSGNGSYSLYADGGNSGNWVFLTDAGSVVTTLKRTNGQGYRVSVEIDPVAHQFKGSITDGTSTFAMTTFANSQSATFSGNNSLSIDVGAWGNASTGTYGQTFGADLSNIVISAVPEPTAMAVIALGGITLLRRRR